ncbi:MAG: 2-oxoacid:acceptor oxidoreductase family protein [Clostridiales bacterium]|nr:2-oxoacid:acceptor oxidoreductase family protein [Clostridiales bacterium]
MSKMEIRLAGSGGQGVILATIILAEAAIIAGKNTAQSQSYGPEARGGMCKAEVIVSDEVIGFTKVTHPTFLLALTQASLDKFGLGVDEDCIVMADSSLEIPAGLKAKKVYSLPILETAKTEVGKAFTANIVAVAAINEALKLVSVSDLEEAVFRHIPKGTEEINRKALYAGEKLAKAI